MKGLVKVLLGLIFMTFSINAFNYSGTWIDNNDSISKLIISKKGTIRAFGSAVPQDYDLGISRYHKVGGLLFASWRADSLGFYVIVVQGVNKNKVKVVVKSLYCDGSSTRVNTIYLNRVIVHDNSLKFIGKWRNENPNTKNLTKIVIYKKDGDIYIHAWGKCHPKDCDWNSVKATLIGRDLKMVWHQRSVTREMNIKAVGYARGKYNRIQIKSINHFKKGIGTTEWTEYLIRD